MLIPPSLAKFLFNLGLKQYPPTKVILGIAAKGEPQGTVALDYFLENSSANYTDYTVKAYASIAFVPAIHKGQKELVKPLGVFSNPDWQLLGFPILDPSLRDDAADKLQIKEHPPTNQLVLLLKESPPTTEAQAGKWFEVLSRRIPGLCNLQSDEYVLIFTRLPSFRAHQIINNANCSYFQWLPRVHWSSTDTTKPVLFQGWIPLEILFPAIYLC